MRVWKVLVAVGLLAMVPVAHAGRVITSVSLGNGAPWTFDSAGMLISAGDPVYGVAGVASPIYVEMTVVTVLDGDSNSDDWQTTQYRVNTTPPGTTTCVNTVDFTSAGTHEDDFLINAQSAAGTYNIYFRAYDGTNCTAAGPSPLVTLTDAVIVQTPAGDPKLGQACGLDVALVVDMSGSIDATEAQQVRDAAIGFVQALLPETPTQFGVIRFSNGATVVQGLTDDETALVAAINSLTPTGFTNWEAGLFEGRQMLEGGADRDDDDHPDLVLIFTDGDPTISAAGPSDTAQPNAHLAPAVFEANAAKTSSATNPIRIVALGVPGAAQSRLVAIAGPDVSTNGVPAVTAGTDVIIGDFADLETILADLALQFCAGTITVHKVVDLDGNLGTTGDQFTTGAAVEDWDYALSVMGGTATPSSGMTDSQGTSPAFEIDGGGMNATVQITETVKMGFDVFAASCTGATGTGMYDDGTGSLMSVVVGTTDVVSCTFYNMPLCDCDDDVDCTIDTCLPTGVCVHTPDDGACDDMLFCNGTETCHVTLGCQPGSNPCTDPGLPFCDEMGDQCVECLNDGHCDDAVFCNGVETCVNFACQPGTPPTCDDGVACTIDSCNLMTDLCDHVPNHAACGDGLFCNGTEICDVLLGCQPGSYPCTDPLLPFCDDKGDQCVECLVNADCDNDLHCDGVETCVSFVCQKGTPPVCDDGVDCTDDSCNETTDSCDFVPNDANCSDLLYCNGEETCHVTLGCQPGTPPNCDDGVMCTDDSCNEGTDSCDHIPNNALCDDLLFCNGGETCHPTMGCQPGSNPCTDPSLPFCDENGDQCVECLVNADCDDGLHCNGTEMCINFVCQPGTPPNCDDGVMCTDDSCNELTDSCDHLPNDGLCDDGMYCNGGETCHVTNGCQPGSNPCTDPALPFCDENGDQCVECLVNADCDDTLHCNGTETCVNFVCQPGTAPDCDDGVACTDDSCNEGTDSCDHVPNDAACDDTLYCNGSETCDAVNGCLPATNPCTNPDFPVCDEVNDVCVECLVDIECVDDGLLCTNEQCVNNACTSSAALYDVPLAMTAGFRAVTAIPQPPGSTHPVALILTSPNFPCLFKYIDDDGILIDTPVFQPPAAWGNPDAGMVTIFNQDVIPSANNNPIEYWIQADCGDGPPSYTAPGTAITPLWGDVNIDGFVNLDDIICELDAFANLPTPSCTFANMNIAPCIPDAFLNSDDVLYVLNAFTGQQYPCAIPCNGGACCVSNLCFLYVPDDCTNAAGTFLGPGSVCDAYTCLPGPAADASIQNDTGDRPANLRLVPRSNRVLAGGQLAIDVFIDNVGDLRSYEVALDLIDRRKLVRNTQLSIDTHRRDYVFSGLTQFHAVDDYNSRMTALLLEGGVAAERAAYLGTFTLTVAPRAVGSFTVGIREGETSTFLRNSNSQALPVQAGPAATIFVLPRPQASVGSASTGADAGR